jgi:hypothetical protein
MLFLAFLLVIPMVKAEPMIIPIINKNQFQACFFGWCQTVAPSWLFTDLTITNTTYYVYNNTVNNITNNYTMNETEPMFNGNFSLFNPFYNQTTPSVSWVQAQNYYPYSNPFNFINSTYNSSYVTNPLTANLNMSFYNTTRYLSSASVPTCTKDYNGATLLWCDCFNTTHKWVANSC